MREGRKRGGNKKEKGKRKKEKERRYCNVTQEFLDWTGRGRGRGIWAFRYPFAICLVFLVSIRSNGRKVLVALLT